MKNVFLRFAFVASLAMVLVLSGCKKDDEFTIAKCLSDTEWNVTSFLANGQPILGNVYSSVTFKFGTYDKADQGGSVSIEYIPNVGTTRKESGDYTINESKEEIVITIKIPQAYLPITYATDCPKGGDLTLRGNVQVAGGGFENWEFIARKQ